MAETSWVDLLRNVALIGGAGLSKYKGMKGPYGTSPGTEFLGHMLMAGGELMGEGQKKRRARSLSEVAAALSQGDIDLATAQDHYARWGSLDSKSAKYLQGLVDARYQQQMKQPVLDFITGTGSGANETRQLFTGPSQTLPPGMQGPPQAPRPDVQGPPRAPSAERTPFLMPTDRSLAGQQRRLTQLTNTLGGMLQLGILDSRLPGIINAARSEAGQMRRAEMTAAQKALEAQQEREEAEAGAAMYVAAMEPHAPKDARIQYTARYIQAGGDVSKALSTFNPRQIGIVAGQERRAWAQNRREAEKHEQEKRRREMRRRVYRVVSNENATPEQIRTAVETAHANGVAMGTLKDILKSSHNQNITAEVSTYLTAIGAQPDATGAYDEADVDAALIRKNADDTKRAIETRISLTDYAFGQKEREFWDLPLNETQANRFVRPSTMQNPEGLTRRQIYADGGYINMTPAAQNQIKLIQRMSDVYRRFSILTLGGIVDQELSSMVNLPAGTVIGGMLPEGSKKQGLIGDAQTLLGRATGAVGITWDSLTENEKGVWAKAAEGLKESFLNLLPRGIGENKGATSNFDVEQAQEVFPTVIPGLGELPSTKEVAKAKSEAIKGILLRIYTRAIAWDPYTDLNDPNWQRNAEMLPEYLQPEELRSRLREARQANKKLPSPGAAPPGEDLRTPLPPLREDQRALPYAAPRGSRRAPAPLPTAPSNASDLEDLSRKIMQELLK